MNTTNGISLDGRKALITGGASGIGAACARTFVRAGAHVTICDLNEDVARDLATEVNGDHWAVDLSDTAALEDLTLEVDILVNNAGVQRISPIHEFDPENWRLIN